MSHSTLCSTDFSRPLTRALAFACVLLLLALVVSEAHARSVGGGRGGGFSRSGPAAGGGFSARSVGMPNSSARTGMRQESLGQRQENRRSEEHTSELQSLCVISYAVFCLKKKKTKERQEQRQDNLNEARDDWQDYDYHDDDWDDYYGYPVVFTGAYSIDSLISSDYYKQLPCAPKSVTVDGVSYRQCGDEWFLPVYSSGQLVYRVVTAPAGY